MGIARKVIKAWIGVSGVARQFWPNTVALSTLSTGNRVLYNGVYYTVIAKDYCTSGDVILWEETATSTGAFSSPNSQRTISTTPFGTTYTNQATIKYQSGTSSATSRTGYGWLIPKEIAGASTTITGQDAIAYFSADAKRVRSTAWWTGDYRSQVSSSSFLAYTVSTAGAISSNPVMSANYSYGFYYAYSVKGTVLVSPNSNGTYTVKL